jgi:hypothetical protein
LKCGFQKKVCTSKSPTFFSRKPLVASASIVINKKTINKMEWIKTILPLIGVALGWLLSESGKIFADKRQDKRKLKKLLFFLLELRYHFTRELSIELGLDKYMVTLKNKMVDKFNLDKNDSELNLNFNAVKPFLEQLLTKSKDQNDKNKYEYLSKNIDNVLIELAEIFPILAYELNGQHNLKERLNRVDNYLEDIKELTDEMPFDFKQWLNPKLTKELLKDLDESIEKISKQISKETFNTSKDKITKMVFDDDDKEMEQIIDEYLDKIIETLAK